MLEKQERMQFLLITEELTDLAKQAMTIEKLRSAISNGQKTAIPMKYSSFKPCPENGQESPRDSNVSGTPSVNTTDAKVLCEGRSIGQRIGAGKVRIVSNLNEMDTKYKMVMF
jgi:pyruvate,water dikinase